MKRIAVLGLGAMGRRMARRLLEAGYDLTVWSRSGVPDDELQELRPCWRRTPREAVQGAELSISMVTDDPASRRVWLDAEDGALAGLTPGALAVESSTLSAAWATELAGKVKATGARFLDAPVVGSRPQADAGGLVYLVGGDSKDVARAQPILDVLGSATHSLGATPNGTIAKLMVNALFSAQVAMLGELLGVARRSGLEVTALVEVLATLPVSSAAAKLASTAICADRFEAMFPIALVAKDLRYALSTGEALGAPTPLTQRLFEIFEGAAVGGFGAENITAVAKLYRA